MEFINSSRNSQKLCYLGFIYTKQHVRLNGTRWTCEQRTCRGAVNTNGIVGEPVIISEHNHLPNEDWIGVVKARYQMKRVAETGIGKTGQIYSHIQQALTVEERRVMPNVETCKRAIRRTLQSNEPPQPDALIRLVVGPGPTVWTQTCGPIPERFLLLDNGVNARRRIIIYATNAGLEVLCDNDNIFMDGTFKSCPQLFMQLYVIHATLGETTVPVVFAYLERKDQVIYDEFFRALVNECTARNLNFAPQHIHIDFEDAVIKSIRGIFGGLPNIQCCFFHLCQNTWKHIQDLELVNTYRNDAAFSEFCSMMDGLAFLPEDEIVQGMAFLRTIMPPTAAPLVDYFDETYVNGRLFQLNDGNIRQLPPQFPPELWCVHGETINNYPRTNNHSEGWNMKYKLAVGHANPTIWKSIRTIQLESEEVTTKIVQAAIGRPPTKKRQRRYVQLQARLHTICLTYSNIPAPNRTPADRERFMRRIGHNILLERS